MLCYVMLCYVMLCYIILYYVMLYYILLCYIISYYITLYYIISYCIILYCIILYYIKLYYIILYYIILYYIVSYNIILHYAHIYIYRYIHALNTSNTVILLMIKIATKIPLKIPVNIFKKPTPECAKGFGDLMREFLFQRQLKRSSTPPVVTITEVKAHFWLRSRERGDLVCTWECKYYFFSLRCASHTIRLWCLAPPNFFVHPHFASRHVHSARTCRWHTSGDDGYKSAIFHAAVRCPGSSSSGAF